MSTQANELQQLMSFFSIGAREEAGRQGPAKSRVAWAASAPISAKRGNGGAAMGDTGFSRF